MLEQIQKRFQNVGLAAMVLLLSAVFILQFQAPNARGCNPAGAVYAARVHGYTITEGDFRAAYTLVQQSTGASAERSRVLRLRELALDGLIERELLAHEAERLGFTADGREVMENVARQGRILSNRPVDAPFGYPGPEISPGPTGFNDRQGRFSSKNLQRFIRGRLSRSVEEFERWQVREALAAQVRDAVTATVSVSPEEIRDEYVRSTDTAKIEYVRFTPTYYRDRVDASEEEIRAWMQEHSAEVDAEYQRQRHRYTGLDEQRRARHILIKSQSSDPEAEREAARTRAQELLRRAQAGEDFAALAREHSEDTASGARGGDLGWNPRGRMVTAFDEAQFGTEPGTITDHVVETSFGFHVIRVEGRREGDVPEEEAKRELAEELHARTRANELAAEAASAALAYLREGHTMEELDRRLAFGGDPPDGTAELPERDSLAPQRRESRTFHRTEAPISGAASAGNLTRAAFERTLESPLPDAPVEVGDDLYVFRLLEREEATEEGFDESTRRTIREMLLNVKKDEALRVYVRGLRRAAEANGAISINQAVLEYGESPTDESEEGVGEGEEESSLAPELVFDRRSRSST